MSETTVCLPTWNEIETAPIAVAQLLEYEVVDEIVVVDDDSPDGTADELRDRFGDDSRVRVDQRTEASGLASAVLHGFDVADGDILACMDADLQHPPSALPTLLGVLESGADLALASRRCETGDVADEWPLHRRVISHGATALAWLAVPQSRATTDPMTGFFAIRRPVYEAVRDDLQPEGYKIALELLARCPISEIVEVGYTFQEREKGASSMGAQQYIDYLRHLARLTIPARRSSTLVREVPADG